VDELSQGIVNLVEPELAKRENLGVVVGVRQADRTSILGFGRTSSTGQRPDSTTLFEIGSVTKVFTTTALACLVNEGAIALEDPVCSLLPEVPKFPKEITVLNLATHTSGLPRLPRNIWWSVLKNWRNPYAAYTIENLYAYLKNCKKVKGLGKVSYSNLGMGLLGHLLEQKTHRSYDRLVRQYITEPLDLIDTRIELSDEQQNRLAVGHTFDGKSTSNWDIPTLAGAGALRSTMQDLLTFVAANLSTTIPILSSAFQLCHQTHVSCCDHSDIASVVGVGLGWFIRQFKDFDEPIFWHNGATGGYQSYVSFVPARQLAIGVLANYGLGHPDTFSTDAIGDRILKIAIAI
jgi:serine-type D-Ala-D-Ala carboxypeptidase/endopeptidase